MGQPEPAVVLFLKIENPLLPKDTLQQEGRDWSPWKYALSRRKLLAPAAEVGVEGAGHDSGGARTTVSAGVGRAVAVPACGVGHGPGPRRVENSTITPRFFHSQWPTVINCWPPAPLRFPGRLRLRVAYACPGPRPRVRYRPTDPTIPFPPSPRKARLSAFPPLAEKGRFPPGTSTNVMQSGVPEARPTLGS